MAFVQILAEAEVHTRNLGLASVVPISIQVFWLAFEGELALMAERLIHKVTKAKEIARAKAKALIGKRSK